MHCVHARVRLLRSCRNAANASAQGAQRHPRAPPLVGQRPLACLVSVAAWTAARRGSCALDSGAARQQCAGAAFDSRPPSVASRLIAVWTAARRAVRLAAVRWTAAQLGSCVLAPPLDSRRPSVASRPCRRQCSGAASSYALKNGAARQL